MRFLVAFLAILSIVKCTPKAGSDTTIMVPDTNPRTVLYEHLDLLQKGDHDAAWNLLSKESKLRYDDLLAEIENFPTDTAVINKQMKMSMATSIGDSTKQAQLMVYAAKVGLAKLIEVSACRETVTQSGEQFFKSVMGFAVTETMTIQNDSEGLEKPYVVKGEYAYVSDVSDASFAKVEDGRWKVFNNDDTFYETVLALKLNSMMSLAANEELMSRLLCGNTR